MIRNAFEPWHLVVLVLVIAVVFGWKKLPDAARSLGRSMRILKSEVEQMKHDDAPSAASRDTVDGEKVTRTETVTHTETDTAGSTTRATHTTVEHDGTPGVDTPSVDGTGTGSTRAGL